MNNGEKLAYPSNEAMEKDDPRNGLTGGGLTKREYFAGLALQGILANHGLPKTWEKETLSEQIDSPIIASIIIADELLNALEKNKL